MFFEFNNVKKKDWFRMEKIPKNNDVFKPISNNSDSKCLISEFKGTPSNSFLPKEENISKRLFDEIEPSQDDEDAKNWEGNTWRIEYFPFCDSNLCEENKTELNPIKNSSWNTKYSYNNIYIKNKKKIKFKKNFNS